MKKLKKYYKKSKELLEIGQRIRNKRISKSITMMDLSFETDIDYRQIGRIERGETNFTIITLLRICKALNCKLSNLIE